MRLGRDGVFGLAPLGGGRWNATLVVPRERAGEISADRRRFFRQKLGAYGVADRFADAEPTRELEITGPFQVTPRRTTAPGVLLTGDAAGYFDPLTGQGIHRALATGRSAAAAVLRMLDAPSAAARTAARAAYEAELEGILAPGRRVQRLVDEVVGRPWLLGPASRLLSRRPGLASLLVDVTGDRVPASALADPRRMWRALATGDR
jgi:flavin-dependent dehydrogenase